jgi:hypothetical protein
MNTKNAIRTLAALLLAGSGGLALAGNISGVKVEPANGQAGTPVKVTVSGEDEGICGLRVEYGNGDADVTKMAKDKDNFPRSFNKTYNKAGTYTIVVKGGRDGGAFGCTGEVKTQVVIAEAPKPAAAPAAAATVAPAVAAAPVCPEGYALNAKSLNKKTGAFSCAVKKGGKMPETALKCPAGTEYYAANAKGTTVGCRVPKAPAKK